MKIIQVIINLYLSLKANFHLLIIFLFFNVSASLAFGQLLTNNTQLDFKVNGSYIMPHREKMIHLTKNHFLFYELSLNKKTNGSKYWHQLYNYPTFGLTLQYNSLGHSQILGNAYALYPYLSSPLIKSDFLNLNFKFGAGLGYLTNKFDKDLNYKNVAISTNLNICINFGLEAQQKINNYSSVYEGLYINHFSNGALKIPNTGINLPSVALGFRYNLSNTQTENQYSGDFPLIKKKYFISIMTAAGSKEIYPPNGKNFPAFSFSLGFNKQTSLKRVFNLNLDLFYNLSDIEILDRKNIKYNKISILKPGISFGHEYVFGKTNFDIAVGSYLYAKNNANINIYNRIGFKRYINKNIFLNLSLKSHLLVADYIEWGCGYKF